MKDCDSFSDLINQYIDGVVNDDQRRQVEQHILTCSSCKDKLSDLTALHLALGDLDEVEVPQGFSDSVMDKIRSGKNQQLLPFFTRKRIGLISAAVLLLVFVSIAPKWSDVNNSLFDQQTSFSTGSKAPQEQLTADAKGSDEPASKTLNTPQENGTNMANQSILAGSTVQDQQDTQNDATGSGAGTEVYNADGSAQLMMRSIVPDPQEENELLSKWAQVAYVSTNGKAVFSELFADSKIFTPVDNVSVSADASYMETFEQYCNENGYNLEIQKGSSPDSTMVLIILKN